VLADTRREEDAVTPQDEEQAPSSDSGTLVNERVWSEQSSEDTDVGWGEYPQADDDRLQQDRPPHWVN
jgi:hypothetical protein